MDSTFGRMHGLALENAQSAIALPGRGDVGQ